MIVVSAEHLRVPQDLLSKVGIISCCCWEQEAEVGLTRANCTCQTLVSRYACLPVRTMTKLSSAQPSALGKEVLASHARQKRGELCGCPRDRGTLPQPPR